MLYKKAIRTIYPYISGKSNGNDKFSEQFNTTLAVNTSNDYFMH